MCMMPCNCLASYSGCFSTSCPVFLGYALDPPQLIPGYRRWIEWLFLLSSLCPYLQKSQFKLFPNGTLRINSVEVYDGQAYNCICKTASGSLQGQAKVHVLGECVCVWVYRVFTCSFKVNSLSIHLGLSSVLKWWHSEATDMSDNAITYRIVLQLYHLTLPCCFIILVKWPRSLSGLTVSDFQILTSVSMWVIQLWSSSNTELPQTQIFSPCLTFTPPLSVCCVCCVCCVSWNLNAVFPSIFLAITPDANIKLLITVKASETH